MEAASHVAVFREWEGRLSYWSQAESRHGSRIGVSRSVCGDLASVGQDRSRDLEMSGTTLRVADRFAPVRDVRLGTPEGPHTDAPFQRHVDGRPQHEGRIRLQ